MTDTNADHAGDGALAYSYRPSVLGAPWEFSLTDAGLVWQTGRKSGRIAFADIHRVRMSYRPVTMQSQRFLTEVWAAGSPKLEICSSSWKSMVEQVRLDDGYTAFIGELHRRLAGAGVAATFEQGSNPLLYWPGLVFFVAVSLGLAALTVRALQVPAWGGAAFVGGFFLLFVWQGGNFFRRNRPGRYRPDAPPREVLPKG